MGTDTCGNDSRRRRGFLILWPMAQRVEDSAYHGVSASNTKTKGQEDGQQDGGGGQYSSHRVRYSTKMPNSRRRVCLSIGKVILFQAAQNVCVTSDIALLNPHHALWLRCLQVTDVIRKTLILTD